MAPRIASIAKKHLRDPFRVTIAREVVAAGKAPRVREVAYVVPRQHKTEVLGRVLDMEGVAAALIFCRTRTEVDDLSEVLSARGYAAEPLHGGLSQDQRDRVMRRLRDGTTQILIATDVAARGLDIGHLSHVVNYDIPASPDAYIHRTGRTGRAGKEGVAITLLEPKEMRLLRAIEQIGQRKISIETPPTVLDIRARRMEVTIATIRDVLEAGDFGSFDVIVEALANDYDVLAIAAAAAKVAHEATAPSVAEAKELDLSVPDEALRKTPSSKHAVAKGNRGAPSSRQRPRDAGKKRSHQAQGPRPRPQALRGPVGDCGAMTPATTCGSTYLLAEMPAYGPRTWSARSPTKPESIRGRLVRLRLPTGSRLSKSRTGVLTRSSGR